MRLCVGSQHRKGPYDIGNNSDSPAPPHNGIGSNSFGQIKPVFHYYIYSCYLHGFPCEKKLSCNERQRNNIGLLT